VGGSIAGVVSRQKVGVKKKVGGVAVWLCGCVAVWLCGCVDNVPTDRWRVGCGGMKGREFQVLWG